jgi:hypothetical protein
MIMIELPKFTKHPVVPGVYRRVLTPEQVREERRREAQEEEDAIVKASRRWLKPIPELEWKDIERIAERTWFGLGGEICDIVWTKPGFAEYGGRRYAILWLSLYVQYDEETNVKEAPVSDAIDVTIYRDPKKPRILRLTWGHKQFEPE